MTCTERTVTTTIPVDVRRTLAPLRHGPRDPAHQVTPDGAVWRATRAFDPPPGLVRDTYRRATRVRIPRTDRVMEALVPAILGQRVITRTAHDAWRWLLDAHGTAAPGPGPAGMRVSPSAQGWTDVPVWDFHRAGVDPGRARTVVTAARLANRMEEAAALPTDVASNRLTYVPGVGPWTAAETAGARACRSRTTGSADAGPGEGDEGPHVGGRPVR